MMISRKTKIITSSIGIVCLLGVGAYGATSEYKNYQEKQIEQAKEQHINEQIEQAKDNVKKIVDDKISKMDCKAEYNCKNSSDSDLIITIALSSKKSTSIDCKFKRTEDSVEFDDDNSFENTLNKYVSEEELAEIRHTVIYDYQDLLYGMAGKISDNVKFSDKDDDYIVEETSDRFFGGDKAYLVTIDSQWIAKDGHNEWKEICLHMEYDKNNKLIDAKYDYKHELDPDKDIKNGVKADTTSTGTSTETTTSNSDFNSTIRQKRLQANWVDNANKSDLYNDYAYELEGVEGSTQNLIGIDKGNISTCYTKYNDYINRLWNELKNQYSEEEFQKLTKDENEWVNKKIRIYPTCDSKNGTFDDKYGAIKMTNERVGELLKHLN